MRGAFVFQVRLQDQFTNPLLRRGIFDRPKQGEAAPLAVDRVLAGGESDVAAGAGLALPDAEANQLQPLQRALREIQLRFGELAGRVPFFIRQNLDSHDVSRDAGGQRRS